MKMKTGFAAFMAAASLGAAQIDEIIVRQQWPWSTDVKVEYKISGVTTPVDIGVKVYDGEEELVSENFSKSLVGDMHGISKDGVGTILIDPVKAFGNDRKVLANFKVELILSDSAANIGEVLYKVFDLESGKCEDITRAKILDGHYGSVETDFSKIGPGFNTTLDDVLIWTGVTNNIAYKTTHLVMRKIPAKGQSFLMGSPEGEVGREKNTNDKGTESSVKVRFTDSYYMSVFEVTQEQYSRIFNGSAPSKYVGENANLHPVEAVSYNTLRGSASTKGASGENINWPTNSNPHEVASGSFLHSLRAATGNVHEFDLPTCAQWEYACRAGTETAFNNGKNLESILVYPSPNLDYIAWFNNDVNGSAVDLHTHIVGEKAPNAWGLYDMHGNVNEFCLDGYHKDINPDGLEELVDPPGLVAVGGQRSFKGGGYANPSWFCRSGARSYDHMQIWSGNTASHLGVRLAFQAGEKQAEEE